MLILTRKVGESLLIGDDVSITILNIRGNQVKIGVQPPRMFLFIEKKFTSVFIKLRMKTKHSSKFHFMDN